MAGRTEARVFNSIWRDPGFICLPASAQRLYLFLLSQDDLSYCGVLPIKKSGWARKAADLTVSDIERDLKWLEGTDYPSAYPDWESAPTPLAVVDYDTDELLIRSLLRRDGIWRQPNLLKLARESAESVDSRRICGVLLAELRRLPLEETGSSQVRTLVDDFMADLEKGSPYPTAYPPPHPSGDPSPDPTAMDHARVQGNGDRYLPVPVIPDPLFPGTPNSLPRQRDRKRGTRVPEPFPVGAEMVEWVRTNCAHVDGKRETERFVDYWRGKTGREGCKLDWPATWRNWMRNAEDRQGPRDRPSKQQATNDQFDRALQRAQAREGTLDTQ